MVAELTARIESEIEPYRGEVELLDSLPGVDTRTAEVILAEIGTDMSRFPTAAHLASWAGACPGNNKTGGKSKPSHTRPGNHWLTAALGTAAMGAIRTQALLRERPVPPRRRTPRRQTRPNRRRAQPARRGLARAGHPNPLPGPRRRLLPQPRQPRPPAPPSHRPTRTARLPGHPRTAGGLTSAAHVIFESTRDILDFDGRGYLSEALGSGPSSPNSVGESEGSAKWSTLARRGNRGNWADEGTGDRCRKEY